MYDYQAIQGSSLSDYHFRIRNMRTDDRIATCYVETNAADVVRLMNLGLLYERMQNQHGVREGDRVLVEAVVSKINEVENCAYVTIEYANSPVCHYPFEVSMKAIHTLSQLTGATPT